MVRESPSRVHLLQQDVAGDQRGFPMTPNDLRYTAKSGILCLPCWIRDRQRNRCCRPDARFLVVRHAGKNPSFYDILLDWLEQHLPGVRARFELRLLPCHVRDWSRYALHVPWFQDPIQRWSPVAYRWARRLGVHSDLHGIPIVNRVENLANAGKLEAARRIAAAGIRTPRMVRIADERWFRETLGGLEPPLLIREDWGHGDRVCRGDSVGEVRRIPLRQFCRPIAVEWIETRSADDGLYRKFRYVAAGDVGVPHHLQITDAGIARGLGRRYDSQTRKEELAYVSQPDPNHQRLQLARTALQLDFAAFDYSYDQDANLVVWEANPYPFIHSPGKYLSYLTPAVDRTLAAMVQLYHSRAGIDCPALIDDLLSPVWTSGMPNDDFIPQPTGAVGSPTSRRNAA